MTDYVLIEITVGASRARQKEIFEWVVKTFGDRVELHNSLPILYFRNQEDAAFFMLKWA